MEIKSYPVSGIVYLHMKYVITKQTKILLWNPHPLQTNSILPPIQLRINIEFTQKNLYQLEQLECLRFQDTPHHPMITNTRDSYWIPSQNKMNQSYKN